MPLQVSRRHVLSYQRQKNEETCHRGFLRILLTNKPPYIFWRGAVKSKIIQAFSCLEGCCSISPQQKGTCPVCKWELFFWGQLVNSAYAVLPPPHWRSGGQRDRLSLVLLREGVQLGGSLETRRNTSITWGLAERLTSITHVSISQNKHVCLWWETIPVFLDQKSRRQFSPN